jgi:tetratricopeptide (TPR) repeat protein
MRFFTPFLFMLTALAVGPALAQQGGGGFAPSLPGARQQVQPPRSSKPVTMDDLFDRLAKAEDEDQAKGIVALIERRWERSGSDTADLLLSRANRAIESKDYPLAVELLDRIITLRPKWAEAWSQRATVFYLMDDPVSSLADLHQVLVLEPRQFNAWAGLGQIFMASEDKARALQSFRRSLTLNPQQPSIKTIVEKLGHEVDGLDL